nr:MAG TPA: hypothetical protein [Caudoviricetes sp.]
MKNRKRLYITVYESLQPNYKNRVNLATKKAPSFRPMLHVI